MLDIRRAAERGRTTTSWLDSRHTFSFGSYFDPRFIDFGPLRAINDDRVAPGGGFAEHGHENMEIVTYVLSGALRHRDSLGITRDLVAGDVQRMTAGTGIRHSEINPSSTEAVHFLQVWIRPEQAGAQPSYEQKRFAAEDVSPGWTLAVSREGRSGSISIGGDADIYLGGFGPEETLARTIAADRSGWLHVARGDVVFNGSALTAGDGVALHGGARLQLSGGGDAEVLLFDMSDGLKQIGNS